ncbi:MAG: ureidoglycolate lyase [Gammaproteobacteria bacterium]|nr:ureidoglycolate lyase [Gammaproteobacteria bacterium]
MKKPQYIFDPADKPSLPWHSVPIVRATPDSVKDYGYLVDDPADCNIEIVRWPAQGWRPVDSDSGDEGGFTEGEFRSYWQGDVLFGENSAVGGHYVLGWSEDPQQASAENNASRRERVLLWHMNYHPDGGQLFFPRQTVPFIVPVALPGDNLTPDRVIAFWLDGSQGLYIHPNIWHEGVFTTGVEQSFLDRQGKVHARVSCNLGEEFGVYLDCSLSDPETGRQ